MKSKISVLGCSPAGIQVAVYLLEQWHGEVLLYDNDVDYAKGMVLDCMQASAVRGWRASLRAVETIDELAEGALLIVTENVDKSLDEMWIKAARDATCTIFASTFVGAIENAIKNGVSEQSILGVQGMIDSKILRGEIAKLLRVSESDVSAMVYGGVGKKMNSKEDFVRVSGIPVNLIEDGVFERALEQAKNLIPYDDQPWTPYYSLAAAAVELTLIMESGLKAVLPINGIEGTYPSLLGNYAIHEVYKKLS